MIVSTQASVKNSNYYKKLGYISNEKYIFVNIEHLSSGSSSNIIAECDYCGKQREISYKRYNNNVKIGNKYACSVKCGAEKAKKSNLEKFGVESIFQSEDFKKLSKKKIMEKWGVQHISKSKIISISKSNKMKMKSGEVSKRMSDYYSGLSKSQLEDINKKRVKTNLERWGCEYVSQSKEIRERINLTNLERWGGYTLSSDILKNRVKFTNLEKWGYEYASKSPEVKNKTGETNLEKWGFKTPSMHPDIKEKTKNTLLERYNAVNIMLSEEFRKGFNITSEPNYIKYLGDRIYEFSCNSCENSYHIDYDNYYKRKLRNTKTCTVCFPISENSSIKELELLEYIKSIYGGEIIHHHRDGKEIDIYLPLLKIGFEFNGLYWHSDEKLDKYYHRDKTNYFSERGIRVIHIWEDDWDYRNQIIKSQIKNWLGLCQNRIFARNCQVKEIVDPKMATEFLNSNHIQGMIRSVLKIGLYSDGELVSVMTFDNNEGRKKMESGGWNLSRFCSKTDLNVIGGASKMFNYFIERWKPIRVISFSDKDWSNGDLYYKLGFNLVNDLKPDYKYIIDKERVNKQRLTKKKLLKMGHDGNLSESYITSKMNIHRVYNVGQLKFEFKN